MFGDVCCRVVGREEEFFRLPADQNKPQVYLQIRNKTGTLELRMRNIIGHMKRKITQTPVPYVTLEAVKSGSTQVQVNLIGDRRRIWGPWGASFRRIIPSVSPTSSSLFPAFLCHLLAVCHLLIFTAHKPDVLLRFVPLSGDQTPCLIVWN